MRLSMLPAVVAIVTSATLCQLQLLFFLKSQIVFAFLERLQVLLFLQRMM